MALTVAATAAVEVFAIYCYRLVVRRLAPGGMVIMLMLSACDEHNTLSEPPPQLLSQSQMVSFLIDLHLAEAKMNHIEVRNTDSLEIIFRNYEQHLLNQHGFTDSVYLRSYEYYLDHMELMNEIYEDVVDSLSVMNSQLQIAPPGNAGDTL